MKYCENCMSWIVVISILLTACVRPLTCTSPDQLGDKLSPTSSLASPTLALERSERCSSLPSSGLPAGESIRDSHILFLAWNSDTANSQVWAVSLKDGSHRLILENLPSPYLNIALLEDGERFLLAGSHTVWLSDLNGTFPTQLENPSAFISDFRPYSPMWNTLAYSSGLPEASDHQIGRLHSPDGRKVAVWQKEDKALRIIDKKSGEEIQVLPTGNQDNVSGSWSSDGKQFAFTYYQDTENWYTQAYIVGAGGTSLHALTQRYEHSLLGDPNWSPDGRQIAFTEKGVISSTYSYRLHVLTLATGEIQTFSVRVNPTNTNQDQIVWSPDGKWIAFFTESRGQYDIHALSLESGEVFCITQDESIREELMDWR